MPNFEVTFDDGEIVTVALSSHHPGVHALIALARSKFPSSARNAVRIEKVASLREGGNPQRELVWAAEQVVQLPPPPPEPIRLFVTFTYEEEQQTTCGLSRIVTGNVLADIEFEPHEKEHITGLQQQIAQTEGLKRVIIVGWQRVTKP